VPLLGFVSPHDVSGGDIVCEQLLVKENPQWKSPTLWKWVKLTWDLLELG
jgi:hypothetical protein